MKIVDLKAKIFPLTLHEPYTIAYQTVETVSNVLIEIRFDNGIVGLGVSAPEPEVTQETPESVFNALNEVLFPEIHNNFTGNNPFYILDFLQEKYPQYPAAIASIDFAIHDAIAKLKKIDFVDVIGKSDRQSITTSITINILSPEETVNKAIFWLKKDFKILKIKGGLDLESDIRKLFLIAQKISPTPPILFDANQGYSFEEAKYFLQETKKLGLIAVEQPVNKNKKDELVHLANMGIAPIMADESACSLSDVEQLTKNGVDFINIKLMKCGGIRQGKKLIEAALKENKNVILSCMDECALSNAYSLALALCYKEIRFVDLDSFTDYSIDPTSSSIAYKEGKISLGKFSFIS